VTVIVDYGMGNLKSVLNAFLHLGDDAIITANPNDLDTADRIVIPGVGAFEKCIKNLNTASFVDALKYNVRQKAKPTLGICVGMQIMATQGLENGTWTGLNWFDGSVEKINDNNGKLRVPNIGWNDVTIHQHSHHMLKNLPKSLVLYFVHSYHMLCSHKDDIAMTYSYGSEITAAIAKDNIFATQFHPEKSQDAGLQIIDNFLTWKP
jgi:imidazole glycerol-phosphate synthase subunit HisH